jgi:hypothetical protein
MVKDSPVDDFLEALQQSVKREVIENYLHERRLLEVQIEEIEQLAAGLAALEHQLSLRYRRFYIILLDDCYIEDFLRIIGLKRGPYRDQPASAQKKFRFRALRFLRTWGLTGRSRYVRLLRRAYERLWEWNRKYTEQYLDLHLETEAVNHNIARFRAGYDVLAILAFFRSLDVHQIQAARFLGGNFRPDEVSSIEKRMNFANISLAKYNFEPPAELPPPAEVEDRLRGLAEGIHRAEPDACRAIVIPGKKAD